MDQVADIRQTPHPRRFYWLKRLALAGLVLFALLIGLRVLWGQVMQSRLDDAIAEIQAKGEPILFADLQSAELPDAENGAWHLMQALQNWPSVPGQPGVTIHDTDWYLEGEEAGFTDPITDNAAYLASCAPVLDTIRTGVSKDHARWFSGPMPPDYNSFNNAIYTNLGDTRRLARLMDDAATRAFDHDDAALGLEILYLMGRHGDQVGKQSLSLIDSLVMISIHAMQHYAVSRHLNELSDEQVLEPKTRRALILLRDWLTDEAFAREVFLRSLIANRWSTHQYVLNVREGSMPVQIWIDAGYGRLITDTPGLSFVLKPLILKSHTHALSLETQSIEQFRANDNLRDANAVEGRPTFEDVYEARPWLFPLFEELFYSDAAYRTYFRQLATRRMTATAIAIRLYQVDHGQRPLSLNELVPDYLPKVPTDPYVGDRPIGYKPRGVVPKTEYELGVEYASPVSEEVRQKLPSDPLPLLYCVGHDFVDNGGALMLDDYDGTLYEYTTGEEGQDHWLLLLPEPKPVQELIDRYEAEYELYDDGPFPADPLPLDRGEDEVEQQEAAGNEAEDEQSQPEPSEG